jgi:hypothetical protein
MTHKILFRLHISIFRVNLFSPFPHEGSSQEREIVPFHEASAPKQKRPPTDTAMVSSEGLLKPSRLAALYVFPLKQVNKADLG